MRERNIYVRETHIDWLPPAHVLTGPGIKPEIELHAFHWEENPPSFGVQANALTTEQNQPGLYLCF